MSARGDSPPREQKVRVRPDTWTSLLIKRGATGKAAAGLAETRMRNAVGPVKAQRGRPGDVG
jgi:hypothetical protein